MVKVIESNGRDARHPGARRVVYVHDSHDFGGMELYLLRLMRHLDRARYEPAVLVPGYTDAFRSSPQRVMAEVQATGVPLLRPPDPGTLRGVSTAKELYHTARLLRTHGTDIVHIHTCRPEGARKVTFAARLAGVAGLLRTEHFPPSVTSRPSSPYLVKPLDWLTDYIVTGSEGDRQEQINLLKRPPEKVYRSYNSVELEQFEPDHDARAAKGRLGLDPDAPVVCNVGRLVIQKGQVYLIEAMAQVIQRYGPVNLLFVGDGELGPELRARAIALNIADHVHFVGFQDDVVPYMQATDVAAMPSLWEVFSLAMLEFMALGKAVVASNHSSFLEAITDGKNGLIVPMKDSKGLAEAILRLLEDEALRARLGQAGLKRVRAHFGLERLASDMMGLYDRVLAEKNAHVLNHGERTNFRT